MQERGSAQKNAEDETLLEDDPDLGRPQPAAPEVVQRFEVGHLISGRYRLERLIARGGMGRVFLATQLPLGRQVAVKILIPQSTDREFRKRFLLEASISARLVHRNIVTVHDYGETEDGDLYMAMEYLDGLPLSKVISRDVRISSERSCRIAIQICRALRAAHQKGVVHRDLKPSNVMLLRDDEGEGVEKDDFVKVLDFGLVKVFETQDQNGPPNLELTRAGTLLGSPKYMAPEQIRCAPIDPRTDVYSLGAIIFHMLAGRPPFLGATSVEILNQHLKEPTPSIAAIVGNAVDLAPELEIIVQRAMEKDPNDRYLSMEDLLSDLKAAYRLISGATVHSAIGRPAVENTSVHEVEAELIEHVEPAGIAAAAAAPIVVPSTPPPMRVEDSVPSLMSSPIDAPRTGGRSVWIIGVAIALGILAGFLVLREDAPLPPTPVVVTETPAPKVVEETPAVEEKVEAVELAVPPEPEPVAAEVKPARSKAARRRERARAREAAALEAAAEKEEKTAEPTPVPAPTKSMSIDEKRVRTVDEIDREEKKVPIVDPEVPVVR